MLVFKFSSIALLQGKGLEKEMQFLNHYFEITRKGNGGGKKNKPEIISSLAFSLPSNKLTRLERKRKHPVFLQSPRHCKQRCAACISPKGRRVGASQFAGTAPSVALPAPIKAAAGALAATWAPEVCYFKGKAIK